VRAGVQSVSLVSWGLVVGCALLLRNLYFVLANLVPQLASVLQQSGLALPPLLSGVVATASFLMQSLAVLFVLVGVGWILWTQIRYPASHGVLVRNTAIFVFLLGLTLAVMLSCAFEFVYTIPAARGQIFLP
jgi:hypothetical protein